MSSKDLINYISNNPPVAGRDTTFYYQALKKQFNNLTEVLFNNLMMNYSYMKISDDIHLTPYWTTIVNKNNLLYMPYPYVECFLCGIFEFANIYNICYMSNKYPISILSTSSCKHYKVYYNNSFFSNDGWYIENKNTKQNILMNQNGPQLLKNDAMLLYTFNGIPLMKQRRLLFDVKPDTKDCDICKGNGGVCVPKFVRCDNCDGYGGIRNLKNNKMYDYYVKVCQICNGNCVIEKQGDKRIDCGYCVKYDN